jgi:type IV pilus assembly protein PilE
MPPDIPNAAASRGFTLIEVLIILVVLAILSAIVTPNFSRYMTRGQLVEATSALAEYHAHMERFRHENGSYAKAGRCGVELPGGLTDFTFSCRISAEGYAYTASATGSGGATGFAYTINQANERATIGLPASWGDLPAHAGSRWVTR